MKCKLRLLQVTTSTITAGNRSQPKISTVENINATAISDN